MSHPAPTKQSRLRAPCKANPKLNKGLSLIFPNNVEHYLTVAIG